MIYVFQTLQQVDHLPWLFEAHVGDRGSGTMRVLLGGPLAAAGRALP